MKLGERKEYKKYIGYFLLISVLTIPNLSFAELVSGKCSSSGYTIATVNGIFTTNDAARDNMVALGNKFGFTHNQQPVDYQYLLNPTHSGGVADLADSIKQKIFQDGTVRDYDLVEMIKEASQKVKTQKLLLVAHSQGNFYANNFYDVVAGQNGGVPKQSIGVYSIATPSDRVAGEGRWITSSADTIIAGFVGHTAGNILPPNAPPIVLSPEDDQTGHGLSEIYLKYFPDTINNDIRWSLNRLSKNDTQDEHTPCITAPALTLGHEMSGALLSISDPILNPLGTIARSALQRVANAGALAFNTIKIAGNTITDFALAIASGVHNVVSGLLFGSLFAGNNASVILANDPQVAQTQEQTQEQPQRQIQAPQAIPATDTINATSDLPQSPSVLIEHEDSSAASSTPLAELPATSTISATSSQNTDSLVPEVAEKISTSSELALVESFTSSGGGGGGALRPEPVPQVVDVAQEIPPLASEPTPDIVPPTISILGQNPETILLGATYADAGATAVDDVDGTRVVTTTSDVNTSLVGAYTVTYTASDLSNNTATSTRVVNVINTAEPVANIANSDLNADGVPDKDELNVVATSSISLPAGEYHFHNLTITNNATIIAESDPSSANPFKGVKIVADNLIIDEGSSLSADGQGYGHSEGEGTTPSNDYVVGATYGGSGYNNKIPTYGSAVHPTDLGSGGSIYSSRAGGAIELVVKDAFTQNGTVTATSAGGGSSGGSIYVIANDIAGAGVFRANGYSLGGGGRIAIHYQTSSFVGTAEALAGCATPFDSWSLLCGASGTIGFFDDKNNDLYLPSSWEFRAQDGPFKFNHIYITNNMTSIRTATMTVKVDNDVQIDANAVTLDKRALLVIDNAQSLHIPEISLSNSSTIAMSGDAALSADTISLRTASRITGAPGKTLSFQVKDFSVGPDSSILTDGGGTISLISSGAFTNDGAIIVSTNLAGGSVTVVANELAGSGVFSANGFSAGVGGHIDIHYKTSTFSGATEANGGCVSSDGWSRTCAENGAIVFEKIIDEPIVTPPAEALSSAHAITSLCVVIGTSTYQGTIDEALHTISLNVPSGTDVYTLAPSILVSDFATSSPPSLSSHDFQNPIDYTVTAEDGTSQSYIVTVTVLPEDTRPMISSYTLNGIAGDVTTDFATTTPQVSVMFTANKNVDWMSVDIEDKNNSKNHKIFHSGADCVDGTMICTKVWDGRLSGTSTAPDGTYQIKAHIKDASGNEFNEYLSPYYITVNRESVTP